MFLLSPEYFCCCSHTRLIIQHCINITRTNDTFLYHSLGEKICKCKNHWSVTKRIIMCVYTCIHCGWPSRGLHQLSPTLPQLLLFQQPWRLRYRLLPQRRSSLHLSVVAAVERGCPVERVWDLEPLLMQLAAPL